MKLVEQTSGVGTLTWRSETYSDVPYSVSRFQAMTAAGLPVPGLHRIEGQIGLDEIPDSAGLLNARVLLELEDGRSMNLTVVNRSGSVLAEGHGPGSCTCC